MRMLALLLFLVVVVETWGIYGGFQTSRIVYTCKIPVGPLCYYWEESAFGKLFGTGSAARKMEDSLLETKKAVEKQFLEKAKADPKLLEAIERAKEGAKEGLEAAGEAADKVIEGVKEGIEKAKDK